MRKVPVVTFLDIDAVPAPRPESRPALAGLLETLARERIMLIFCSGRTRAEVESKRQAFGVFHPFVCEGGAAAFIPERYFGSDIESTRKAGGYQAVEFALPYDDVVQIVRRTADRLSIGVLGFNDMSVEQVARECGLSLLDARLAKLREYSEPFRLLCANPVAERRLFRGLEGAGLVCQRSDSFHQASAATGFHSAIALLTRLYRIAFGSIVTAATTDGTGAGQLIPHIELALPSTAGDAADPFAARDWLESLVHDIDILREARIEPRAARFAR